MRAAQRGYVSDLAAHLMRSRACAPCARGPTGVQSSVVRFVVAAEVVEQALLRLPASARRRDSPRQQPSILS